MSNDHVTLRIPKWALTAMLVLLIPAAFATGMAVGRGQGDRDVAADTTIAPDSTAAPVTTTSVPPSTTAVRRTTTTTAAKKKPKAPAAPKKPTISATYSDNCPAPGINNRVAGTMIIKWTSTNADHVSVRVDHGADGVYQESDNPTSGEVRINRTCNNMKTANGTYPGTPLTVTFSVTAVAADGTLAGYNGEDSM